MSLRVVADNTASNVAPFPGLNLADVAQMARNFAEALESGKLGEVSVALLVIQDDNGVIDMMPWGDAVATTEVIGILELAKAKVVRDSFNHGDDD